MFHVQNLCYCNTWVCLSGSRTSCCSNPAAPAWGWYLGRVIIPTGLASSQQPQTEAELNDLHFSHPILPLPKQHFTQIKQDECMSGGKWEEKACSAPCPIPSWAHVVALGAVGAAGQGAPPAHPFCVHVMTSKASSEKEFSCHQYYLIALAIFFSPPRRKLQIETLRHPRSTKKTLLYISILKMYFSFCSVQTPSAVLYGGTFTGGGHF